MLHKPLRAVFPIVQRGALQKRFIHCACCTLSTGRLLRCSSRSLSLFVATALLLSLPTSTTLRSLPTVPALHSHSCLLRAYLRLISSLSLSSPACPQLATTNSKSFSDILFCSAHSRCPTHGNSIREESERVNVRATDNCERAQTGRAPQHYPCRRART